MNRAVRPLLRALRRITPLAHYFGRDVVSVKIGGKRHDVGALGFAHDSSTETAIFEALVAVHAAPRPTLSPLAPLVEGFSLDAFVDDVARAYAEEGAARVPLVPLPPLPDAPPWDAVAHTPFARIGAIARPPQIGGDFFVSRDWLDALNRTLATIPRGSEEAFVRALFRDGPSNGGVLLGVERPDDLAAPLLAALRASGDLREQAALL